MGLSFKERQQMLADTKSAAAAFLDDIAHIRAVTNSQAPTPTEIRHLSNLLRRLLHESDLTAIAAPRLGKIHILAPVNATAAKITSESTVLYQTGSPLLLFHGVHGFEISFDKQSTESGAMNLSLGDAGPMGTSKVRLDGFMAQKVICFRDKWVSRREVIKFAAICGHGVHSASPRSDIEKMLATARTAVSLSKNETGQVVTKIDFDVIGNPLQAAPVDMPDFIYDPHRVDLVLIEVFAAAYYLLQSDDVIRLENAIRQEFS